MNKVLRGVIVQIKAKGGDGVSVRASGRHTFVEFTVGDKRERITVHRGNKVPSRFEPAIRSQMRRAGLR
jgi:hypothetical protein